MLVSVALIFGFFRIPISLTAFLSLAGCAIMFGHVQPLEQQALVGSRIPALSHPWTRIAQSASNEAPDVGYQNDKTGSTLALTSGCRPEYADADTQKILLQITSATGSALTQIDKRTPYPARLDGIEALMTTFEGTINGRKLVIQTIVAKKSSCVYDVTLVSLKRFFDGDSSSFSQWVAAIHLP